MYFRSILSPLSLSLYFFSHPCSLSLSLVLCRFYLVITFNQNMHYNYKITVQWFSVCISLVYIFVFLMHVIYCSIGSIVIWMKFIGVTAGVFVIYFSYFKNQYKSSLDVPCCMVYDLSLITLEGKGSLNFLYIDYNLLGF